MTIRSYALRVLRVFSCAASVALLQVGSAATPADPPADPGWPRQYTDGKARLLLFQPQVDSWKDFKILRGRFATELTPAKGAQAVYGSILAEAETKVDLDSRVVSYAKFEFADIRYPSSASTEEAEKWTALTKALLPNAPTSVSLDRILAYMDLKDAPARSTPVSMAPPPILISTQPAVLVIIDQKPIPLDIDETELQKIVNTNWDLFFNKKDKRYYLRNGKSWMSSKSLTEAWTPVSKMPKEFKDLPETDQYRDVKYTAAWPQKAPVATLVLVATKPSELIVLTGEPTLAPVAGTRLQWVTNTESDLFFDSTGSAYYFLTSGRWFCTKNLKGGRWEVASPLLPSDFAKIPANHPRAHVLAAVPGTKQAELAVLAASIPQKAQIERKSATAKVDYVGDPRFEEISGQGVSYASNTPNDVLKVGELYYLCLDGVWFVSGSASGPWDVTEKVPDEIYAIPPSSPKHHVTYVKVYESTIETVTYGYTAGYTGTYVDMGVAMWGTGYYYPYYYGYGMYAYPAYWACPYYTYGASAWYNPATGAYVRGSGVYGPYGGYGRAAAYNPSTGRYSWGQAAYGPYGAAASGGFYNPRTGGWGGSYHASNGYQSWGQSVVGRGDRWARTASYSDARGSVGAFQTSSGGKGVAARSSSGERAFAARSGSGDIYAGRDGNIYKRDQSTGDWYKNSGSSWDPVSRSERAQSAERSSRTSDSLGNLNRDASARQAGNSASRSYSSGHSRSSSSGGGWSGSRGGGYASRGGGFGGRRR